MGLVSPSPRDPSIPFTEQGQSQLTPEEVFLRLRWESVVKMPTVTKMKVTEALIFVPLPVPLSPDTFQKAQLAWPFPGHVSTLLSRASRVGAHAHEHFSILGMR